MALLRSASPGYDRDNVKKVTQLELRVMCLEELVHTVSAGEEAAALALRLADQQTECQVLRKELSVLLDQARQNEGVVASLKALLVEREGEVEGLRSQQGKASAGAQSRVASLQEALAAKHEQVLGLANSNDELQKKVAALEEELRKAHKDRSSTVETLSRDLDAARGLATRLSDDLRHAEQRAEAAEQKVQEAPGTKGTSRSEERHQARIRALQDELDESRAAVSRLELQLAEERGKADEQQAAFHESLDAVRAACTALAREAVEEVERRCDQIILEHAERARLFEDELRLGVAREKRKDELLAEYQEALAVLEDERDQLQHHLSEIQVQDPEETGDEEVVEECEEPSAVTETVPTALERYRQRRRSQAAI
eukprot:Sspe_Gene.56912::Locus_31268_Transcript_2_2_Confidence_0.750_Length_2315::g.56912::m.56912